MLVTLLGIVTEVKLVHLWNAFPAILVTPLPITIDLIASRYSYHGISEALLILAIAPVPRMVKMLSQESSHVRFPPHVPEIGVQGVPPIAWIVPKSFHIVAVR